MSWFKLVGSTENPVPNYWDSDRPDLLTEIRFPWNKPPDNIWAPGNLILYPVGAGALIAVQQVNGPPQLRPRRGAPGTPDNRWPHKVAVLTKCFCSPVSDAPKLREAAPEFAEKYKGRFWNGSHWSIEDSEYKLLAGIIESAGSAPG